MTAAVYAAVLSAALGLAAATPPAAAAASVPHAEFAGIDKRQPGRSLVAPARPAPTEASEFDERFFDGPRFEKLVLDPLAQTYQRVVRALIILIAALILVSGVDDAFVDACYWLGRLGRRERVVDAASLLRPGTPELPFAIMVPAWKEHEVIAAMIENTVETLDYPAFRIFCGVYANDPATAREVGRMAARYPGRVTRVEVPHDGPTCKADCLNYIVHRILQEEHSGGRRFAGMVLHDSEDVIHPLELRLFNALLPQKDLVQLPVFSLERKCRHLTAGTYVDDFAEAHGKDMAVREALVGIVPGAGVATCYSRRAMEALCRAPHAEPFNTATLTEDYELSFRLKQLGMALGFAHVTVRAPEARAPAVRGRTGSIIATHEYFPDGFKAAYRQRARWVLGIAFQGWRQLGWRGSALERYFFFRDRKAMVMAPAGALAYLLLANVVLALSLGSDELRFAVGSALGDAPLQAVLVANLAFMCNRALQRMYFVGRYYGPAQALLSLVRMPVNNLINFFAVMRAWRQFLAHLASGKKLVWDKTAHVFPDAKALAAAAVCSTVIALWAQGAVAAPPPLTGPAYELAERAYRALEKGELERALCLATEALGRAPGHAGLLVLQADILARQGKPAAALASLRGLSNEALGGPGLAQRGYLWLETGNPERARADFTAALSREDLEPEARGNVTRELAALTPAREASATGYELAEQGYKALESGNHAAAEGHFTAALAAGDLSAEGRANVAAELAYLALGRNDDHAALRWFEMALASPRPGASSAGLRADAGYAATRLGRNRVAVEMLSAAVDDWHAAPAGSKPFDDATLFGMRRSVDTLSRRWAVTASLGRSTQAAAASGLGAPGRDIRVTQAGAEISYTPEAFGYRNERIFQLYANAFQAVSATDGAYATGKDSRVAGLGARYKPFQDLNLVFAVERRLALGDQAGEDDWLLRLGWSAGEGTDWNPTQASWTSWQLYTETVYFSEAGRLIQPFEARLGRSWKWPRWHGAVTTVFAGIGGEYDDEQSPKTAAGIGPGIAFRLWLGESRYRAFPAYLDFSLQYRFRLTDARRGGGVFGQLMVSF